MQKIKERVQTYKVEPEETDKLKLVNILKQLKTSIETLRTTSDERYKNIQDELVRLKNQFNELQTINTETFEKLTQTLESHKIAINKFLEIDV